jgi:hypothetical protein
MKGNRVARRKKGDASDYLELIDVFRLRADQLHLAGELIDEVAGLPARYCSKLFGRRQIRRVGMISLGPLLGALGIKLVIVEDQEALARVRNRLVQRNDNLVRSDRRVVTRTTTSKRGRRAMVSAPENHASAA